MAGILNREKAVRYAYFNALNGNLTYDDNNVPIVDSIVNQGEGDYYVVLEQQTAMFNPEGGYAMQSWTCDIRLVIITKQPFSASKDIMDDLTEQMEQILTPSPNGTNLNQPSNWQLSGVYLKRVEFTEPKVDPTKSVLFKMLTFSQKMVKQPIL